MSNVNTINLTETVISRLWATYELVDTGRRRTFYILLSMSFAFLTVLTLKPEPMKLPLVQLVVTKEVALEIAPFFIAAVSVSYFYLCAHTLKSYVTYLVYLCDHANEETDIDFGWLYGNAKRKDVTEGLNIYHVPILPVPDYDKEVGRITSLLGHIPINAVAIVANAVPFIVYFLCAIWVTRNVDKYGIKSQGLYALYGGGSLSAAIIYSTLMMLSLLALFYFRNRCKPARKQFLRRCFPRDYGSIFEYYGPRWSTIVARLLGVSRT